jgi:XTP/dITP diphosphohydrolase
MHHDSPEFLRVSSPLVLASHNLNKIAAMKEALVGCPAELLSARQLNLQSPDETGNTVLENALIKARSVAQQCGHAAISDDSGFFISALDDLPGAAAVDWAGPDGDHTPALRRIGDMLSERGLTTSAARYVTVIAAALPEGTAIAEEGATHGHLVWPPRGKTDGYLSVFALSAGANSIAELMVGQDAGTTHDLPAYAHRRPTIDRLMQRIRFS